MNEMSGWGRFPKIQSRELIPQSESELVEILRHSESYIPRGNGRSYGDSAINKNLSITMTRMNRFLKWNQESGELVAESGVLIADIIDTFLPRGWFPYVTPGTKFITLGGAIACDVHGKNHHNEGSFGNHVNWIEVFNDKNEVIRCSPSKNSKLFHWTIGGMGLTGVIIRCSIQLKKVESGWIKQQTIVNNNLNETLQSFYEHQEATYSVAWIDCLANGKSFGRSILMLGEHAQENELHTKPTIYPKRKSQKITFPFDVPSFLLNNLAVSAFNKLYFKLNKNKKSSYVDWDSYFYPLDSIGDWNRMYGKNGLFQFQCVLPREFSEQGYTKILSTIQNKSSGSFLAVLKDFGPGNGQLSFPSEGLTLALDFKVSKRNIAVGKELIDIVNDLGGSFYLAKDAIMDESQFNTSFDRDEFLKHRNSAIKSEQSIRIKL
ncbi:FAD-binding oxidoreductase [Gammaproteobacteria bacterium]|nr:FAD-binding oxidoreductase [Gammaproteobacteria bacterium]